MEMASNIPLQINLVPVVAAFGHFSWLGWIEREYSMLSR